MLNRYAKYPLQDSFTKYNSYGKRIKTLKLTRHCVLRYVSSENIKVSSVGRTVFILSQSVTPQAETGCNYSVNDCNEIKIVAQTDEILTFSFKSCSQDPVYL